MVLATPAVGVREPQRGAALVASETTDPTPPRIPAWTAPLLERLAGTVPRPTLVAVAMSGGVDSSVAAALLATAGLPVVGVTMRLWAEEEFERGEGGCCSLDAVEDARRVCARLGIPHYVINLREQFERAVVGHFLEEYRVGRTPNPCVRCNETVKFADLYLRMSRVGASHLATGHYAQLEPGGPVAAVLRRARDPRKDQSYTLYRTPPEVLARCLFPLGTLEKTRVRELAAALGLGVAAKPDSQELCFVGGGDHRDLLARELTGSFSEGPVVDRDGMLVGRHRGLPFYTVGQRHGLGLESRRPDAEPLYVYQVDRSCNTLRVGPWTSLLRTGCRISRVVALVPPSGRGWHRALAQLRAHAKPTPVTWRLIPGDRAEIHFATPQAAVSPGQSLVLYDGDQVVAGGEIEVESGEEFD
jgi:tRNA-specific 2-thiouridylase